MVRVFIVDDEKWMRDTIVTAVNWEAEGFELAGEACDGLEAVTRIRQVKPDLVLADIQMPGMDGITLYRAVKESGLNPLFIYFSGYDRFEYAQNALNLGAWGYLLKPIDEEELLEMLLKAKNHILAERQKNVKTVRTNILDAKLGREVTACIERCDYSGIDKILSGIGETIQSERIGIEDLRNFNRHLIELIFGALHKLGLPPETIHGEPDDVYDVLDRCVSIAEVIAKDRKLILASLNAISMRNANYYKKLIISVKLYIQEHYMEDISLESVAQEFSFHPNYFSKLYKEETGQNFIDFLTQVRIETAKDLLRDVRLNILEVATKVGYRDAKYFTKVFKKVVGHTPTEYLGKHGPK